MKTKLQFSGYFRSVVLSIIAAFALLAIINADDVRQAFHSAGSIRNTLVRAHSYSPKWLQIPETVAKAIGKVWYAVK